MDGPIAAAVITKSLQISRHRSSPEQI